jgi:CheY-like chemotaxis protein
MPCALVVDDSPSVRFLIRTNLELAGFEVIEAEDGVEALRHLQHAERLPDVVTLDVMMPRQSGLATAEAIRSDPRTHRIPIVMVTTQSTPADVARGERAGVDAYVAKPFDPDVLVETIHRAVDEAGRARDRGGPAGTLDR